MSAGVGEKQANPIKVATNEDGYQGTDGSGSKTSASSKDSETSNCKKLKQRTIVWCMVDTVKEEKHHNLRKDTVPRVTAFGSGSYNWKGK